MNGRKIRLGSVSFLNAKPLHYGLDYDRFEVAYAEPSKCADWLERGEVDCALLPVASLLAIPDLSIVPGIAIAARGPVETVLLVGQVPWNEMSEIALDEASRTSALLVRLLSRIKGYHPQFAQVPHRQAAAVAQGTRGALVIGDEAFALARNVKVYPHQYDLSAEWMRIVHLPFVFAVWAGRRGTLGPEHVRALEHALSLGLESRPSIAAAYAQEHGGDPADYLRYLTERIRYHLGADEASGLREFFVRCHEASLASHVPDLVMVARPLPRQRPDLLTWTASGGRLETEDAIALYREAPLGEIGHAADERRFALHPDPVVTYIVDRNVNYTNVCVTRCKFCNFYRPPGHDEGYVLSRETLAQKFRETIELGGVQILLQGGLHPELRLGWYEDLFRWIKANFSLNLHALSPAEITHLAQLEGLGVGQVLERLAQAGLDSVPGGGAEILDDEIRNQVSPLKCTTDEWLEVMRQAHRLGLRSSSTMVFGFGETPAQLVGHLVRLRDLQDETGGFTAFICWPFQSVGTRLKPRDDTSAARYLRVQAIARLVLDNVPNIQVSWPTMGPDVGQIGLRYGGNDFGSIMIEENVVSTAGAHFMMTAAEIERQIRGAGFVPQRRNQRYEILG